MDLSNFCEDTSELTILLSDESDSSDSQDKAFGGQQHIGLRSASSFLLGAIIGAGIFITPAGVLRNIGSLGGAMIVWCCSGLIAAMGAFCYLELGTMFPQSGCDFVYIRTCFGELPAFLFMWSSMVVFTPVAIAIKSLTFANYVLEPFFLQCVVPLNAVRMVAAFVVFMRLSDSCEDLVTESTNLMSDESDSCSAPGKAFRRKKRTIGLRTASSFLVGAIVGAGIFVTPTSVLRYTGSLGGSMVIWCSSGLIAAMGALVYLELGTSFPQSGSDFIYIRKCWGKLPAFMYMWISIVVVAPANIAIKSLTFANYILEPMFLHCIISKNEVRIIAAVVICLLTYINCRNVTWATRVQDVFTFAKILALIIIIIAGAFHLFSGHTENFDNAFEGTTREPGYIALAFYSGLFSYAGWNFLNFVTEELKDPFRNLPRAIYISLPLVTVIYVLANVAYFAVLTTDEILSSNAVAVTFGERILGVMSWIMPFSVALSTFGGLNGNIFASARLFFVGAREGHLPSFLSMINLNYFTPTPSLVFLCILSLAYLSTTEVYVLINYTAFVEALFVTLSVAGLVWLRYKKPDLERPIKVPLILPLTFLAVCLFLVTFPFYVSPWETGMGIAITLSGIPVYALTIFWENKPKFYRKTINKFTVLVQKVLLSVPEEKYD